MSDIDVAVLREGTEGLSMRAYADELRERLPDREVRFAATPAAEREAFQRARVVTGIEPPDFEDESAFAHADNLELFACTFSGTDHLPLQRFREADVTVTNASGIHAPGIAEQVLGYLLVFARNLHEGWRRGGRREWRHFQSGELGGSTVTIVGMGAIGTTLVERLSGFPVHTIAIRHSPGKGGPTDEVYGYDPDAIGDALSRTDYLVCACPLTDRTRGLVGADALATLPPEAVVVNVARGPVVDTGALVGALRSEAIRGAALDVTDPEPLPADHPLWTFENCLITPHTGGHTPEHWPRLAAIVARNVRRLDGERDDKLENVVS